MVLEGDRRGRQSVRLKDVRIVTPLGITVMELPVSRMRKAAEGLVASGYQDAELAFPLNAPALTASCAGPVNPSAIADAVVKYEANRPHRYLAGVAGDLVRTARGAGLHCVVSLMEGPRAEEALEGSKGELWLQAFGEAWRARGETLALTVGAAQPVTDQAGAPRPEVVTLLESWCRTLNAAGGKALAAVTLVGRGPTLAEAAGGCAIRSDMVIVRPLALGPEASEALGKMAARFDGEKPLVLDLGALPVPERTAEAIKPLREACAASFGGVLAGELVSWPEGVEKAWGLGSPVGLFATDGEGSALLAPGKNIFESLRQSTPAE
jgi:hypothetical protein